jgi:Tol biopolymer transport system component/DNA-binding winged helix-turn-helix (wHTH) protein
MVPEQENVQFGLFTANLHAGELKKGQHSVPLQNLPFRLLAVLLREPGRVFSRGELRQELWPVDTFVDFERGISTAVNKLREALGDSANNSRFIETVGRRGYRFIAPVSGVAAAAAVEPLPAAIQAAPATAPAVEKPAEAAPRPVRVGVFKRAAFFSLGIVIIAFAVLAFDWIAQSTPPKITRITQLTYSGKVDRIAGLHTDGSRLFFIERSGPTLTLMQTSVTGGEEVPVPVPFPQTLLAEISPDRSQVILTKRVPYGEKAPLWITPIQGGTPQRVGDILVSAATWFPDGQRLLCSIDREVFSVERDGSQRRHLFDVEAGGPWGFKWSPDGSSLRFAVNSPNDSVHLWEASADGSNMHPLLPGWRGSQNECCGTWSPDGHNYVFASQEGDLWLLHEGAGWPWRTKRKPVRLTNGPTHFSNPVFSPDEKKIFADGLQPGAYVARLDAQSRQFSRSWLPSGAIDLAFSHDGKWISYIAPPGLTLWRSKLDGSEKLQLTAPPTAVLRPRWSPDDKKILFVGRLQNQDRYTAFIVPADGGSLEPVIENDPLYRDYADWSPDQNSVVVGVSESGDTPGEGITLVDLATHKASLLPGSKGLSHPRWSPRGDYIAASSEDFRRVLLFNTRTQEWRQMATVGQIWKFEWERDGSHVLYEDVRDPLQTTFRLDPVSGQKERVADCSKFLGEGAMRCTLEGVTPDGGLMFSVLASWANLYAFDVELP